MKTTYVPMTCGRFARQVGRPPRTYGYTIAIFPAPTPEPTPARVPVPTGQGKRCGRCSLETAFSQLHDITSCGDWMTVCGQCRDIIAPRPKTGPCTGWYKHKATAVRRADEKNRT